MPIYAWNTPWRRMPLRVGLICGMCSLGSMADAIASDASELARAAQNPVADMISVPFQNNSNFNVGPRDQYQNILNIQPVVPVNLSADWNLITRTIVPVISQPDFGAGGGRTNGIGDIQFSAFFSPKRPTATGWIWGLGPIFQLRSATDDVLGEDKWGIGPTAVALHMHPGGPWVYGALINNVWSVAGDESRRDVNRMTLQPFINYNFPKSPGLYLSFSPIITADWKAGGGERWTVPLGLGIGQVMRFGKQPVNLQAAAYYNVERPSNGAEWQIRMQLQLLFPK